LISSVRFQFFKPGTEKTEPNQTKPNPNRKNQKKRAKLVWTGFCSKKPKRSRLVWIGFGSVSVFLKSVWLFFYKNQTEPKMNTKRCLWKKNFFLQDSLTYLIDSWYFLLLRDIDFFFLVRNKNVGGVWPAFLLELH